MPLVGQGQPGDGARHRDALVVGVVDAALDDVVVAIGGFLDEDRLPLVGAHPGAGAGVELDHLGPAFAGAVDEHHPTATDPAHLGVDHALAERGGDGRIDGISTLPQHLEAGLGGQGLRADDHGRHLASLDAGSRSGSG